jgi:hypothetical protein
MATSATVQAAWITGGAVVLAAVIAGTVTLGSRRPSVQQSVDHSPGANVLQAGHDMHVAIEPGRRVIAPDAQEVLRGMLRGGAGSHIHLCGVMGDQETIALAEQLKLIFVGAGWIVEGVDQLSLNRPLQGMILQLETDTGARHTRAEEINQALSRVGLTVHGELLADLGDNLRLIVGSR